MMSPGKDETRVCGYIRIYICLYVYYMCTCKYVEKERAGALFASNLLCNELHDSCRKESQNLYTEATIY